MNYIQKKINVEWRRKETQTKQKCRQCDRENQQFQDQFYTCSEVQKLSSCVRERVRQRSRERESERESTKCDKRQSHFSLIPLLYLILFEHTSCEYVDCTVFVSVVRTSCTWDTSGICYTSDSTCGKKYFSTAVTVGRLLLERCTPHSSAAFSVMFKHFARITFAIAAERENYFMKLYIIEMKLTEYFTKTKEMNRTR